ncbi:MAG: response regulator [bacterium]|nr:response regulator [bacterium]
MIRVLVADDEKGMRLGVSRSLRDVVIDVEHFTGEFHVEVIEAEDGDAAWSIISEDTPDIILLDHQMPGITGMELLARLNEQKVDALAIMITAYASLDMAVKATKQGAFDFLAKPFTPGELRTAIEKATRHLVLGREARRLAQEKRQLRFQFLSVLAHELKAPLGAVEGYLQLLSDGTAAADPETVQQMIDRSLLRVEGMRKLIYDLLDLTRIESGQKTRELVEVDLRELALLSIETMQPDADKRRINIALEAGDDILYYTDRSEMEIILNNLISNAVKYNRDGGSVRVTIGLSNDIIDIAVADTGIGMSEQDQKRLFGEFVRIKNSKTRKILGSGLGLSIMKRLTGVNEGKVSVISTEGEGSTFSVKLPYHANRNTGDNEV